MTVASSAIPCEYISWRQVERLSWRLAQQIRDDGFKPDLIVAIGRGGYVPARIIADCLHIVDLIAIRLEHYKHGVDRQAEVRVVTPLHVQLSASRILIVDDVSDSGDTFVCALEHISRFAPTAEIRTVALHHKIVSSYRPDWYGRRLLKWRWLIYPWAVVEDVSGFIRRAGVDPADVTAVQRHLQAQHQVKFSTRHIKEILSFTRQSERP